jgi:hypothetical protein
MVLDIEKLSCECEIPTDWSLIYLDIWGFKSSLLIPILI